MLAEAVTATLEVWGCYAPPRTPAIAGCPRMTIRICASGHDRMCPRSHASVLGRGSRPALKFCGGSMRRAQVAVVVFTLRSSALDHGRDFPSDGLTRDASETRNREHIYFRCVPIVSSLRSAGSASVVAHDQDGSAFARGKTRFLGFSAAFWATVDQLSPALGRFENGRFVGLDDAGDGACLLVLCCRQEVMTPAQGCLQMDTRPKMCAWRSMVARGTTKDGGAGAGGLAKRARGAVVI